MKTCRRPTLNMTKLIADLKSERSLRFQKTRTRNILNLNLQTCVRSCWCYSFHRQRRGCACPPGAWTQSTPGLWGQYEWWEKVATYQKAWWEGRICCTWPPWRVSTASLHTAHRTWKQNTVLHKTDRRDLNSTATALEMAPLSASVRDSRRQQPYLQYITVSPFLSSSGYPQNTIMTNQSNSGTRMSSRPDPMKAEVITWWYIGYRR